MADEEHVKRLRRGVAVWNAWRLDNETARPDLRDAVLSGVDLCGAALYGAALYGAKLSSAYLHGANLSGADLSGANLSSAYLSNADLTQAYLGETIFANVDLTSVIGLETCIHQLPSTVDHRTLQKSGPLPRKFLRGVGLPDELINEPKLFGPKQYYTCFISYSAKETAQDKDFAKCLEDDLQNKGVRCWFAPHDLPIGRDILEGVDAAIRVRDKVLLILSEHSIGSGWVKDEVNIGFEEERKRGRQDVLFPLRLDDAVTTANEAWVAKLRQRNIGDFRQWKDHDAYKQSFARVLSDLTKPREVS
jgi:TIR domain/Pentapeptide repeats (8 copies)